MPESLVYVNKIVSFFYTYEFCLAFKTLPHKIISSFALVLHGQIARSTDYFFHSLC